MLWDLFRMLFYLLYALFHPVCLPVWWLRALLEHALYYCPLSMLCASACGCKAWQFGVHCLLCSLQQPQLYQIHWIILVLSEYVQIYYSGTRSACSATDLCQQLKQLRFHPVPENIQLTVFQTDHLDVLLADKFILEMRYIHNFFINTSRQQYWD